MSELRQDPVVGRWVIIAPDRANRPQDFQAAIPRRQEGPCPFCLGNEETTPPEIMKYRGPDATDTDAWRVRVVPNKFPALQTEGDLATRSDGMYGSMNGVGAHEVIIECPQHERNMSRLPAEHIRDVLRVYRDRLLDRKQDSRLVYGLIFKNVGVRAGASLEHSHSQLIVTPTVPITVMEELQGSRAYYEDRGRCIYCDMIRQELADGKRIVLDTPNFLAFCPYASRFPFETWLVPKWHSSHYEHASPETMEEMGQALKALLAKLEAALDGPPYNYIIHTGPFDTDELKHYHWHFEIFPRLTRVAGFEWGSGFHINPVPPEQAATRLRNVKVRSKKYEG